MPGTRHCKILILGSGPAGYTAAIYAGRAMRHPVLVQGIVAGGQLTTTSDVENFPGFVGTIQGPWLMEQMRLQAEQVGAEIVSDHIEAADLQTRPFRLVADSGAVYTCDVLIICTGADARWLGLPSEQQFRGRGVSACATCDGFFFRNRDVVVVGGGNTALEEALFLSNLARSVTIVHRRDTFRGEKILQERVMENGKISICWNTVLERVEGRDDDNNVAQVHLRDVVSGRQFRRDAEGVFIAIGHSPATALFQGQLHMKPSGHLVTAPDSTSTSIAGVFAAGDVRDDTYRQAITAAGMGCMAALEADRWLSTHGPAVVRQAERAAANV